MKYNIIRLYLFLFLFTFFRQQAAAQIAKPGVKIAPATLRQPDTGKSLQFIQNKNQWDKSVQFMAPLPGGRLFLQATGLLYTFFDESQLTHTHDNPQAAKMVAPDKIKAHAYGVTFLGAGTAGAAVTEQQATEGVRNYFIGNDPRRWAAGVKSFEEVTYQALYPGIAMHLYEKEAHLKYEFLLEAQADPGQIKMQYKGADELFIRNNELHIKTSVTEVVEQKPYAYQLQNNQPVEVPCYFKLEGNVVTFEFPEGYDRSRPLVIDPVLVFSSYSGSQADNWGFTATYDEEGNMYSGGIVAGIGFPATIGAYDIAWNGITGAGNSTGWDIGILKYKTNASGAASLLYATYLGGSQSDIPNSLVVNSKDELLILGVTGSNNYPTTAGAQDRSFNGGSGSIVPLSGIEFSNGTDLLITRLNANGSALLASTYLGGTSDDGILSAASVRNPLDKNYGDQFRGDIFTDSNDQVYIVSSTRSSNFPVVNGFQNTFGGGGNDGIIAKLTPALALQWSSFMGGSGVDAAYSVQLDTDNNIFICGGTTSADLPGTAGAFLAGYRGGQSDGFVAKINNNGSALQRVSYIGTTAYDQVYFVQLDEANNVYLLGQTLGSYPVSNGVYAVSNGRQFIQKLNNDLTGSLLSTTFGVGNSQTVNISPTAFLVDNCSRIYVAGWGGGANANTPYLNGTTTGLPVTPDGYQRTTDGKDFYLMLLSRDAGTLEYATFFGAVQPGTQSGEHVDGGTSRFDKRGFVYQAVCAGCGGSSTFPTTPNAWSRANNAANCNNGAFKFDFNIVTAEAGDDQAVCANAPAFQLTGFSPATGGTWSGPGVTAGGTFTPSANLIGVQTITYTVANGSCISTSTKIITILPLPVVSFTGLPPTICLPVAAIPLIGTPVGGTFTGPGMSGNIFTPVTAGAGTHTITYSFTNPEGCTVTSSRQVVISVGPVVEAGPDERICSGSFPVTLNGFSPASGTWSGTGVSANGLFTPSEGIVGTHILTYTVTSGSCIITKTKTVTVDPTIKFTQGPDLVICPDAPAFAITDIIPPGGTWSGTGVNPQGIFTPTATTGSQKLTYTVTIGACSGISTKNITVSTLPVVQAAAVPSECGTENQIQGFAPFTASFTNTTTGATSYLWDFGDGGTSTEAAPSYQYGKDGYYEVSLTVFFGNGCRLKRQIASVQVEKKQMVPNVFTPNNDGLNDTFIPRITCLPTDLKIFNRWGKQVYAQQNYQNNWGGEGLSDGIYYYQLTSTKGQIWKGWVEIIR